MRTAAGAFWLSWRRRFLNFAINGQRSSQILLQFKLLAAHFGLIKPSPENVAESPFERPTSYVLLTEGRYPSLVTVPAVDLQARIKTSLPIIEYGDFVEKQGRVSPENKVDEENRKCTICLCEMERSETMRELSLPCLPSRLFGYVD
ncbi:hypothetical protein SDJN03_02932, partial [Cucurbita argyrosperma subsp. sororia]